MPKTDKSVVRNKAYRSGEFNIRERHNERKNESYGNGDIIPERSHLNVHFNQCASTYEQAFNKMLEDGTISTRGLKADAKVFDELVFDVNTAYFEHNGGYEYAKQFFKEAYQLAVKETGGEQYVLSAVMHADERNSALSEQLGRDVYHYHLHVVYIPVVDKEVKWTKRCKDPALVGTTKEVIQQVSHSKKWPKIKSDNGWVNSYSLLQDRFFEHMRENGYHNFERGERGSTVEHLSVIDYKIQQDIARAATLEKQVEKKQEKLSALEGKINVGQQTAVTFQEIEAMPKKTMFGKIELSLSDWSTVSNLAKEGVKSRSIIANLQEQLSIVKEQLTIAKSEVKRLNAALDRVLEETREFRKAIKMFPQQVKDFFSDLFRQNHEKSQLERQMSAKTVKTHNKTL